MRLFWIFLHAYWAARDQRRQRRRLYSLGVCEEHREILR